MDINQIRKAIMKTRGGHENDTDAQILIVWRSLPAAERERLSDKKTDAKKKSPPDRPSQKTEVDKDAIMPESQ